MIPSPAHARAPSRHARAAGRWVRDVSLGRFSRPPAHRYQPALRPATLALGAVLLVLAGCRSVGPKTVPRDRFDYSEAITESWKRQTLLNIIKLRYLDPPIWVDVGQIVSGYTLETSVTGGLSAPESNGLGGTTVTAGGAARFTDRPTITYVPLTGAKFINGLMTPIPPSALFRAIQAGWPADSILLLGAANFNGLSGEIMTGAGVIIADSKFTRVLQIMRSLQLSGFFSIRVVEGQGGQPATMITLRAKDVTPQMVAEADELRDLLGLDRNAHEFRLIYGSVAANDREIAVTSRSLIRVLGMLATHADLPPEHVAEGRAMPGVSEANRHAVRFYSGKEAPKDAFVAVRYRDHWFWIDDRDLTTKRAFTLIMILFTMADSGPEGSLPVLTIPTG
jgi:hypothetical protein